MRIPTITITASVKTIETLARILGRADWQKACQFAKRNKQTRFEILHLGPR